MLITLKSLNAPVVTLLVPKINSSAARPPISESILANNCAFVERSTSLSSKNDV